MLHNSLQYLPNLREILVITSIATIIEGVIEPILNLGSSIFAKDVFRDMAKIPGSAILDHLEVNVGETKYKYDDACDVFAVHGVGGIVSFITNKLTNPNFFINSIISKAWLFINWCICREFRCYNGWWCTNFRWMGRWTCNLKFF